jgi:tetratricopeptide (TPR) repeat protein
MNASKLQDWILLLKSSTKKIIVLLVFFLSMTSLRLTAQNINGFKIQVSADTTTSLTFNSKVVSWQFEEENGFLVYDVSLTDDNKMRIIAKQATVEILHLNITEGKRKHKFVLLYKEGVDNLQTSHDYSDLKKLEEFVKNGTEEKMPDQKLLALITEADKAFQSEQYDVAKVKYEQALQMDSNNDHAKKQLAETDNKIAEKKRSTQKELDDKFNNAILKANAAWLSKNYDEAIKWYNEALAIKPGDEYSKSQVQVITKKIDDDKLMDAVRKRDSLFNSYIAAAEKAFHEKLYESAINTFTQALSIKPGDPVATSSLKEVEKEMANNKEQEENKKLDTLYKSYIAAADKAYLNKLYEEAKIGYKQASNVKPGDKYSSDQLSKIDNEIARIAEQKEREQKNKVMEDEYNAIINLADSAYNMKMWELAKDEYIKASKVINKIYPNQRIAEIDKKLEDQKNAQIAEKQKHQKDSINNTRYSALVEKADHDFEKKDYNTAEAGYKEALTIKDEQYPKEKLVAIENILVAISARSKAEKDSITKENEMLKKYNALITKARIAYTNNNYADAQSAYEEAAEIKPNEEEPKVKLSEIDKKLADLVKAKDIQDKYDSVTAKADLALGTHDYDTALQLYKQALNIKPDEAYYLQKQIDFLQRQLTAKDSSELEVKKAEDRKQKFNDGMNAYNRGRSALKELRYEDALLDFKKFLELIPDASELNANQYNQQELINFAKSKVKDLNDYLARSKAKDTLNVKNIANEKLPGIADIAPSLSGGMLYYPTQKDLTITDLNEIKLKYPLIDFNQPPREQQFNENLNYSKENTLVSHEMLLQSAQLNLQSNSQYIKLSCQGINFKDSNVYIRLLVQNNDTTEFLTGAMLLTLNMKDGSIVKLYPAYISNFPIVLPEKEKAFIYMINARNVSEEESLNFEVTDRLQKIRLLITIPGETYNQEQSVTKK